jgi:hypothetical protein
MSIIDTQAISSIDALTLSTVHGGQESTISGQVKTPAGEAGVSYSTKGAPERRRDWLTCMNDRQANCGTIQSAQSCQAMALSACEWLKEVPATQQTPASDQQQPPLQPGTGGTR